MRNNGSLVVSNEKVPRSFVGKTVRVLGGGRITATHLEMFVNNLTLDSFGTIEASMHQHPFLGKGASQFRPSACKIKYQLVQ